MTDARSRMDRQEAEARVEEHLRNERLIAGALMAGVAIAIGLGSWAVTARLFDPPPLAGLPPAVTWAVAAYVLASILAAGFVERKIAGTVEPGDGLEGALQARMRAVILGMALREGPALLGVVWGALSGSLAWLLALGVLPLISMGFAWPGEDDLRAAIRRAAGEEA